ncbi:serine/threonine-protein kinase [Streptomyces sp. NPDC090046]|uniref:serine/threonine-protein kinase n=1 Tax=Streptomyces sp. NPDC090046 TaxID=3365928 RepID=UPI003826066B
MEAGNRLAGRYKLVGRIGRGGMGEVWQGLDEELQRPVAVKILREDIDSTQAVARFRREATIGARLRHAGITTVHDVGRDVGRLFMVMELLEGHDLAELLAQAPGGLPAGEAVELGLQITDALAAAHEQGIVHRDLKPGNVFLHEGRVKICDFGIARAANSTTGLTGTGLPFGTPPYMAPEQWRGEHVDARCDLYALGCLLYIMLTGTPPFTGDYYALRRQHLEEAPQPLRGSHPEIPSAVEDLVLALLAKDPQLRPADARTVHTTLTTLSRTPEPKAEQPPQPGPSPTHSTLVTDLLKDANTTGYGGDHMRAAQLALTAAEVATRILGPDHPDTLTARSHHAHWTGVVEQAKR